MENNVRQNKSNKLSFLRNEDEYGFGKEWMEGGNTKIKEKTWENVVINQCVE